MTNAPHTPDSSVMAPRAELPELEGARVTLRALAAADAPVLCAIRRDSGVAAWWGPLEPEFPLEDEPESIRFTIWVGAEIAGMVQFGEEAEPAYRHATVDMFIADRWAGQGLGTDALRTLMSYLTGSRGHHRVTIDPASENPAAIRCYEKAGFRPVGVLRYAERAADGRWRDVLLMEWASPPPR